VTCFPRSLGPLNVCANSRPGSCPLCKHRLAPSSSSDFSVDAVWHDGLAWLATEHVMLACLSFGCGELPILTCKGHACTRAAIEACGQCWPKLVDAVWHGGLAWLATEHVWLACLSFGCGELPILTCKGHACTRATIEACGQCWPKLLCRVA